MSNPEIDKLGNKVWYNELGQLHRDHGPACEYASGNKFWYINGKLHREDGPAIIWNDGMVKYYINSIEYPSLEEGLMDQAIG